jgi:ABC-2 type transport system permease protein
MMEDMHGFQLIVNFIIMPMFFLSGALFPLDTAPEIIRYISYIDPLTYAVEAFRFLLTGNSVMPLFLSAGAIVLFLLMTTFSAAYLFNRIED